MTIRSWTNQTINDVGLLVAHLVNNGVTDTEISNSFQHDHDTGNGSVDTAQSQASIDSSITDAVAGNAVGDPGVENISSNYTIEQKGKFILLRASGLSADINITLPSLDTHNAGCCLWVVNFDNTYNVNIVGLDTSTPILGSGVMINMFWDGSQWCYATIFGTIESPAG